MIKIENVVLPSAEQWKMIIMGARNPKNSWDKSDSHYGCHGVVNDDESACDCRSCTDLCGGYNDEYILGNKDIELMKTLSVAGTDHRKFMRMIVVYADITAPLYWWKEYETYKIGTVTNSCSTMFKIADKEFTLDDFSCEHLMDAEMGTFIPTSNNNHITVSPKEVLERFILPSLNHARTEYLETKDKKYWWQIIQLLPSSYNQKRTVMLNYEVLANMYKPTSRRYHKLDEWNVNFDGSFCKWIESLPYSELITQKNFKN